MKYYTRIIVYLFLSAISLAELNAQQTLEKLSQTFTVNQDATLEINASHCNFNIETWNKDYIEITATVTSKTQEKEVLQTVLEDWNVRVFGDKQKVSLTTNGGKNPWSKDTSASILLKETLEAISTIPLTDGSQNFSDSLLESLGDLSSLKELPKYLKKLEIPKSPDGSYHLDFDYKKYDEEGEAYLNRWSEKYREQYGESFENEMRDWAKNHSGDLEKLEKDMEQWGDKFGKEIEKKMEKWGEGFEKRMEEWGKDFDKKMEKEIAPQIEAWAENFGEELGKNIEAFFGDSLNTKNRSKKTKLKNVTIKSTSEIEKNITIKIPKKNILKIKLRHGELYLPNTLHNSRINVSHGSLNLAKITGEHSAVTASYASLKINEWEEGELDLNYVDYASINKADNLSLSATSSNVNIARLGGSSMLNGSFGDLLIKTISPSFKHLNIVLENSKALVRLPKTDFNLFFSGRHSQLNNKQTKNKVLNASTNTNKAIVINANYSSIKTK